MPWRSPAQRGVTPQGRGRFPGFDSLGQSQGWDDVTAGVVLARLAPVADRAFFTRDEIAAATALLDRLLGQDEEPRVPVVGMVDVRLAQGETDGWHYDDLPPDGETWRRSLAGLDADARGLHAAGFAALAVREQAGLVQAVHDRGEEADPRWHGLHAAHLWSLWTRYACAAFYSHPWAWNEIGFGGPAYPRGYKNLGLDARERWEVADSEAADPVPFAGRVERARSSHEAMLAPDRAATERSGGGGDAGAA